MERWQRAVMVAIVLGVVAIVLGVATWSSAPRTEAARGAATPPRAGARGPAAEADPSEDGDGVARATADEAPSRPGEAYIPPSTRPFDSPMAASSYVRGKVLDLLAAVAPEIDPEDVTMECEADGRICTFHGPWPGDDLLKRWLKAITEQRTSNDAMGGVHFSRFAPVDGPTGQELEIVAHAP